MWNIYQNSILETNSDLGFFLINLIVFFYNSVVILHVSSLYVVRWIMGLPVQLPHVSMRTHQSMKRKAALFYFILIINILIEIHIT